MLFSATFAPRSRGVLFHRGFSLVEFLVSVLLITAIAVLSLPTFRDFAPHSTYPELTGSIPAGESAATTIPGKDSTIEESGSALRAKSGEITGNSVAPVPEARARSPQGGKPQ